MAPQPTESPVRPRYDAEDLAGLLASLVGARITGAGGQLNPHHEVRKVAIALERDGQRYGLVLESFEEIWATFVALDGPEVKS